MTEKVNMDEIKKFQRAYIAILDGKESPTPRQMAIIESHLAEQSKKYAEDNGEHCRFCGHDVIEYTNSGNYEGGGTFSVKAQCNQCETTWYDSYKLTEFTHFEGNSDFLYLKKIKRLLDDEDEGLLEDRLVTHELYESVSHYKEKEAERICECQERTIDYLVRKNGSAKALWESIMMKEGKE